MTKPRGNEAGFTLISVLVATTMLVIGLMALARTQALLARTQGSTATRATALAIAQGHVELLRSQVGDSLGSEPAVAVDDLGLPSSGGKYRRETVVEDIAANLQRVTVRVSSSQTGLPIELVTLVFRDTP